MTIQAPIRVAIRHADLIVCSGIHALLQQSQDFICGPAERLSLLRADVVILDYHQAIMQYRRAGVSARAPVLVVNRHGREQDLRAAFDAGVSGYLLQHCTADELADAVRSVARGERYLPPSLNNVFLNAQARAELTAREEQVLRLLARGCRNKEIARELGIGLGTVKIHAKGVFHKLGAHARTHAVALATQRGMLPEAERQDISSMLVQGQR